MFLLIKGAAVYAPEEIGVRDILVAGEKVVAMENSLSVQDSLPCVETIEAGGAFLVPGLIDNHVHILGGGGEGSYRTRTPELSISDCTRAGVTAVIGVMGTDDVSRSPESLLSKARGLEEEGLSTRCLVGSYQFPMRTVTGSVRSDLVLIDKFIGVGEVAISDHRSSQPTWEEFASLVGSARVGGMLSGKGGVVNVHMGDGPRRMEYLFRLAEETEIPITQLLPTHVGRNPDLYKEAKRFVSIGGYMDLTTSMPVSSAASGEVKASKGLKDIISDGLPIERVTLSSDGQGSLPEFDEKGKLVRLLVGTSASLFREFQDAVLQEKVSLPDALKTVTSNVADVFKLPSKGRIKVGNDGDLVLLDPSRLEVKTVIAKGSIMIRDGEIQRKGTFEQ